LSAPDKQEVLQIEIDKIMIPEDRVTSVLDEEILAELEESIKQHGILQPLQVAEVDGKYILIDGLHRLQIAKKLGMRTVPCIVKRMTEDQLLITNLIVNRQRGRSNPAHEALVLKKLLDEYGYDINKAAELLGMSASTADKYYRIASNCSEQVLDALGSGEVSVGCAYWLSFIEDKNKQNELLEYIRFYKYTVEQCKSAVLSLLRPEEPTPYIITPTGEPKPRPIPVYPCGREVDPSKVVMIQFDADVWPMVQQALEQLCKEGFFYELEEQPPVVASAPQTQLQDQHQQQQQQSQQKGPERKKDWFTLEF